MTEAVARRLAELSTEHGLPSQALESLRAYAALLSEDPRAPTGIREPRDVVELHIADSLDGLRLPEIAGAETIADIGSGAGAPGIVLAIARPRARVTLIESAAPKARFLQGAVERLGLRGVDVVHARVESTLGAYATVTARAVASLPVLVEYAAPILDVKGALVAWKGRPDAGEERDGDAAAAILGLASARRIELPARRGADGRSLYVYSKVRDTPDRFPRRPGMARKRPLSA